MLRKIRRKLYLVYVTSILLLSWQLVVQLSYFDKTVVLRNIALDNMVPIFNKQVAHKDTFSEKLYKELLLKKFEEKSGNESCVPDSFVIDGLPWPNCQAKMDWLKNNWKVNECYEGYGVNGTTCSMYNYLSNVEKHCPIIADFYQSNSTKDTVQYLSPKSSLSALYQKFGEIENYKWMKNRIQEMEGFWVNSSRLLFQKTNHIFRKKKIHVHLGLMKVGIGKTAGKGGPLGELVQWSDIIVSLFVLGHDVTLTQNLNEVKDIYKDYTDTGVSKYCPSEKDLPFDVLYTDLYGAKDVQSALGLNRYNHIKCKLRIVDSFGTEAALNLNSYASRKMIKKSNWGGREFNLQQFNTMFPHTPDNTFMGFVIENPYVVENLQNNGNKTVRDIALVYGKLGSFWKDMGHYLDIIHKYFKNIHATAAEDLQNLPPYVINHGVLPMQDIFKLYKRTKLFIGLGFPFEGPAPLEAIANGAIFLNPIQSQGHEKFYENKPTKRNITSQHPYVERFIKAPHAFTVDIFDEEQLETILKDILHMDPPKPYLPREFTFIGMLERLRLQVEKQEFCQPLRFAPTNRDKTSSHLKKWWPPLEALQVINAVEYETCTQACERENLICEPSYFPIINRKEAFPQYKSICNKTVISKPKDSEIDYPAFDNTTATCYIQSDKLLFSCAGRFTPFTRLCPCRDFLQGQVALCKNCFTQHAVGL